MMKFGKFFMIAMIAFVAVFCAGSASAAENEPSWFTRPVTKLGRGIANVAFGVLELPMQWTIVSREDGGIAGLTYGTLKGVGHFIARVGVGIVEIVTFPFPLPDCPEYPDDAGWGYGPILRPEWIVPVGSDWNSFVYDDESIVNPNL